MSFTLDGILLTGAHGSRPAANASGLGKGSLYSCTTHGLVYQTNGSSWSTWATLGSPVADILDLTTAETDDTLVLAPDGAGGVEFRAETGGGGGDLTRIAETVLGSDQADITFTGISNAYRDLIIVAQCRGTNAGNDWSRLYMRMGDGSIDTGTNYGYMYDQSGTGSGGSNTTGGASEAWVSNMPSAGSTAGAVSATRIELLGYASTSRFKTWVGQGSGFGASENYSWTTAGVYRSTSAEIDQLRFYCPTGDLKTLSRIAIYGRA